MVLTAGSRLGPYEILSAIGVGGMGEVYRAHDRKLNRDVAVKILPDAFASDPDRLARLTREAQTLAALNHPNIAHVHGLDESGGVRALVMELVEGEDLSQRLRRGPIPLDEALPIAKQIAEALEAAHERGIVHRDLKPANIKVRPDATVKVLDFGLAKAFEGPGASEPATPTITAAAMTIPGMVLGTAAYMPPEQARGKPVDRRADLWAFGCVLFEMLTGRRPFGGETIAEVMLRVIERPPEWTALPAQTPAAIRQLLRRCLEKDPRRRLDSAAVARLELDDASTAAINPRAGEASQASGWPLWALVAVAVLAAAAGAVTTWAVRLPVEAPPLAVSRFAIALPPAQSLAFSINDRDVALSADGTRLAYTSGDQAQLMVRALDQLDAVPLAGIANVRAPFLSPDGRWIAFFDRLDEAQNVSAVVQRGALRRVSTSGGPPITIAALTGASRGASWGSDDSIVFATNDPSSGLLRVSAGGGEPEILTKPDADKGERDHYFPSALPGMRGVLFTITGESASDRRVAVLDLKSGDRRTLLRSGSQAEYLESGHLIYADGGSLWAVQFDAARLEVVGEPVPLIDQILTLGAAAFSASRSGSLVYVPTHSGRLRSLVWVDRRGAEEPIAAPPRGYVGARLSPDGTRIAVHIREQNHQVLTWDVARAFFTQLTFGQSANFNPVWTPDGQYVVIGTPRGQFSSLSRRKANGTGAQEELTTEAGGFQRANAVSPDGTRVVFEELTAEAGYDLKLLHLEGTPRVEALLSGPYDERNAAISPDGRWMAYESNDSGQSQIYVRPFPDVKAALYQVSRNGGRAPVWDPQRRELYFINGSSIMAATVDLAPTFSHGNPTKLFEGHGFVLDGRFVGGGTIRTYDVSPVGERFLMIKDAVGGGDSTPRAMIVVQNWHQELKAKVRSK